MEQALKQQATETPRKVERAFAPKTARRLETINEDALNAILDDFDADQEIADAITHNKTNNPNDFVSYEDIKEDWKNKGFI